MTFAATVITLYPEMFPGPLGISLAGRALARGDWSLEAVQLRDFATDRHRTVDDTPAGGGAGMVLKADVLAAALDSVAPGRPVLAMTPRGTPITQPRIRELAAGWFSRGSVVSGAAWARPVDHHRTGLASSAEAMRRRAARGRAGAGIMVGIQSPGGVVGLAAG